MAAQLCPKDIEATFYAAMMSLANLGGGFSSVWGGVLMDFLHIVKIANDSATANATTAIHTTTTASSLLSNSSVTSILNNNTNTSSTPASPTPEMYDFTHLMLALWLRVGLIILGAFLVFPMIPYTNEIKANVDDGDGVTPINDGSDGYNQLSRDSVSLDHSPSPTSSPTLLLHSGTKRKSSDVIRREDGGSIQMSLFETSVRISGDRVSREHLRRRSGETFVETRSDETSVDDGDTASLLIK